ncbi:MAG: FMN-binding protein, partial [Spirochaetota bacterium]
MKKDSMFASRVYPVLFMVALTVVFISGVSGIFLTTEDRVRLNETIFQKRAVLYAAGIEFPEEDIQEIQRIYEERVREVNGEGEQPDYFRIELPSGETGYAVYVRGAGLWGEIVSVFGFKPDLETFTGVEFVEQNETPGLGARITEQWYKEQFRDKRGPFELVAEGSSDAADELDAITGATKTSEAVLKIANRAAEAAQAKVEEGGE